ncbi:MAG: pantoate--beta-alanine ligase [Prevotellaceae bacterium]|nr:pantoate--beta-alanine ligase [Prevotellaceae bacterium]
MIITNSAEHMQELTSIVGKNKTIGFVPTMGALHQGHLSLVKTAMERCDFTVVSIFVNPTQFNNPDDFKTYPRTQEVDTNLLSESGVNLVFIPSEKEIYPIPDTRVFDFGEMDKVMEGVYRPGHFNGVAQVITRLFNIVNPTMAFFGEKDFQQLALIKLLVEQIDLPIQIVSCPIVREYDGLAMSSRNRLLNNNQRMHVPLIARTLFEAKEKMEYVGVSDLSKWVKETLDADPELKTEYAEIVNAKTLQPIKTWDEAGNIQLCVAVHANTIRLIDNIRLK